MDFLLWKKWVPGFHITPVIIHSLTSVIVFRLLKKFLVSFCGYNEKIQIYAAFFGALFFSLCPLRVESVSWISERKDVLCAFFYCSSLLAYFSFTDKRDLKKYSLCILLFILACLSKSMAVTLPAVLILFDIFLTKRLSANPLLWFGKDNKSILIEKIPFFVISFLTAFPVLFVPPSEILPESYAPSLCKAVYAFAAYPFKTLFPFNLSPMYVALSCSKLFFWTFVLTDLGIVAAVSVSSKKQPVFLFSMLFYCITIFPVIGLLNGSESPVNDRYCYIPSLSFSIVFACFCGFLHEKYKKNHVLLFECLICIYFILFTIPQQRIWHDSLTLFSSAVLANPASASAHFHLAEYVYHYDKKAAFEEFSKAMKLDEKNVYFVVRTAGYYYHSGDYEKSLELAYKAYGMEQNALLAWQIIGQSLQALKKYDKAEEIFVQALKIWPSAYYFSYLLSELYIEQGRITEAEKAVAATLNNYGTTQHPDLLAMLCGIEILKNNRAKAYDFCKKAVEMSPKHEPALKRLAELSARAGENSKGL
jgi:Tfp pilus assembly protein PilF